MPEWSPERVIALCGQGGAGKDTLYECLLKPKGYLRWQMTLHYKVWLVSTGRFTWDEVFDTKPPEVRKVLQEEITAERYRWSETIWLDTFKTWMRALHEIVGVEANHVAITDMRFLVEMAGVKALGGKILHIESADPQANIDPLLREVSANLLYGFERFILQSVGPQTLGRLSAPVRRPTRGLLLHGQLHAAVLLSALWVLTPIRVRIRRDRVGLAPAVRGHPLAIHPALLDQPGFDGLGTPRRQLQIIGIRPFRIRIAGDGHFGSGIALDDLRHLPQGGFRIGGDVRFIEIEQHIPGQLDPDLSSRFLYGYLGFAQRSTLGRGNRSTLGRGNRSTLRFAQR
jgi:hypothetical protein